MKTNIILLLTITCFFACSVSNNKTGAIEYHDLILPEIDTNDYLFLKSIDSTYYQFGSPFAFVNSRGDTIIPSGKYYASATDTLKTFAIVYDSVWIGIDRNENVLFQVFIYDNGPDYLSDGLFRVIRNGKIGYANEKGAIVIPCQFDCAYYFENGKAKVSDNCKEIKEGEYKRWESDSWYFIDKAGKRID